jgi:hypothetical protein
MAEDGQFQPGDLVAFHGRGPASTIINLFTWGWPFARPARWAGLSHVAVVGFHPSRFEDGDVALYESTTGSRLPCLYNGWPLSGVQVHPIEARLAEYDGLAWHYPLSAAVRDSYNAEAAQGFLWSACRKPYDWHQCLHARSTPLGWLHRRRCRCDADAAYYCSELVAGTWRTGLGSWQDVQQNPNRLFRRARKLGVLAEGRRLK